LPRGVSVAAAISAKLIHAFVETRLQNPPPDGQWSDDDYDVFDDRRAVTAPAVQES
jgi:hypothetical protein